MSDLQPNGFELDEQREPNACGWCGALVADARGLHSGGPTFGQFCTLCWAQEPWMYVYGYGGYEAQGALPL